MFHFNFPVFCVGRSALNTDKIRPARKEDCGLTVIFTNYSPAGRYLIRSEQRVRLEARHELVLGEGGRGRGGGGGGGGHGAAVE